MDIASDYRTEGRWELVGHVDASADAVDAALERSGICPVDADLGGERLLRIALLVLDPT
jgi:hypothetical protein